MSAQREMKGRNPWNTPVTILITVIGVIAIVALVTVVVVQNRAIPQKFKYGIVMDAGSSHTSVYIYRWPSEKDNDTGRVEEVHSCQVAGPGISSYAPAPWRAGESLKACMREAEQQVPQRRHQETSLYLGATAGMRLLSIENSSAAEEVLRAVEETLQKFPFSYQGSRTLSGQEEGAFGWVTVNYLDERLKQVSVSCQVCLRTHGRVLPRLLSAAGPGNHGRPGPGRGLHQISFVSDRFVGSESPNNSMMFRLYGNDYNLYTHSFLCYGKDQALRLTLALQTQSGPPTILDPCFHPGYEAPRDYSSLYASPCVSGRAPQDAPVSFMHRGTGNFFQCQKIVRSIFSSSSCKYSQCSFNGVFQPLLQGKFGAFSAYFFVMNFLNLTDTSMSLDAVKLELARYCSTPWDQIKGSDAGWTLGYMLNLTNMIPAEAPDAPPLPQAGYVSIVTVMAVLLVVVLLVSMRPLWPRCSKLPHVV
ncbi:Ectonucleoside triphosphate diphosphohydrolase 1 [Takifugu flavidus]|uniref:Ectonucleoside triphosphate diphosphohydrolase 1 n=1 Tax=Takifugu flavidus TaxID=433684 RepID=A0A5C6MG48_9TELE|nr:Ectonucleoside triphosphate diphosphohydrolase 1 [Takifugu flavidus]